MWIFSDGVDSQIDAELVEGSNNPGSGGVTTNVGESTPRERGRYGWTTASVSGSLDDDDVEADRLVVGSEEQAVPDRLSRRPRSAAGG